jgi:hypothetical protein
MRWNRVTVVDSEVAQVEAVALIQAYAAAFKRAGMPPGATVFHKRSDAGHHLYFFSPEASVVAVALLDAYEATPCTIPDLAKLRRITV